MLLQLGFREEIGQRAGVKADGRSSTGRCSIARRGEEQAGGGSACGGSRAGERGARWEGDRHLAVFLSLLSSDVLNMIRRLALSACRAVGGVPFLGAGSRMCAGTL